MAAAARRRRRAGAADGREHRPAPLAVVRVARAVPIRFGVRRALIDIKQWIAFRFVLLLTPQLSKRAHLLFFFVACEDFTQKKSEFFKKQKKNKSCGEKMEKSSTTQKKHRTQTKVFDDSENFQKKIKNLIFSS